MRPIPALFRLAFLVSLGVVGLSAFADTPGGQSLGQPGYLVIVAAADSSGGFHWTDGPTAGHRSLSWDQGILILPDSLSLDASGPHDLGVRVSAEFTGSGASGQLLLKDGIFSVSEPVTLTDRRIELRLTAGELEIRGPRIRYRREASGGGDFKSGLLLLAGMTLLVIVLLRRARLKTAQGEDR